MLSNGSLHLGRIYRYLCAWYVLVGGRGGIAQVEATIGLDCTEAIPASAKAGIGIKDILEVRGSVFVYDDCCAVLLRMADKRAARASEQSWG